MLSSGFGSASSSAADAQSETRSADLRTIENPQTGELNVFWDGTGTLFRAPLTGAMRKG